MAEKNLQGWLSFISEQHWQTMDLGLDRMQEMVARMKLAPPHGPDGRVVTIAGTNGKGSTALALEKILSDSGLLVGTTLSPHIHRFNERIRVGGEELADDAICRAFSHVEAHRGELPLTYFEYAGLAALWSFQQARVDVAVLEIGLGGRLDAFNIIDADVAVITSIALDHQEFLGDNVEDIGREKAGILRRGQAVVTGPNMPDSVFTACTELDLVPRCYGRDFHAELVDSQNIPPTYTISEQTGATNARVWRSAVAPQNVAVAIAAASALADLAPDLAMQRPPELAGLEALQAPGRMQIVAHANRTWVLDVAHNPAGVEFLTEQLQACGLTPTAVVCGMLKNKDHQGVADILDRAYTPAWVLFDTRGDRHLSAQELRENMAVDARCVSASEDAVDAAVSATAAGDVILVLGSFNAVEQFAWLAV